MKYRVWRNPFESLKSLNKYFYSILICLLLHSCSVENVKEASPSYELQNIYKSRLLEGKSKLRLQKQNNIVQIEITYHKQGQEDTLIKIFKEKGGLFYELKRITNFENKVIDSIWLLAFAKEDTSFNYIYDFEKYPPTVPEGYDEWNYEIGGIDKNNFYLKKSHLRDSTFKEEYFYDRAYKIKKVNLFYGGDTLMFGN